MNPSTPNIRSLWRTLRPSIKEACTFSEIKDIVASAAMPVEQLSHLQQKSLPEKSSSKSELMDAVDILVSKEPDPDEALRRLVVALQQSKPHVKAQGLVESVTAEIITPTGFPQASPLAEGQPEITQSTSLDIFISHSGKDADVAEALIDLIRAALD
ncbi:MAG: hypothetical protein Q8M07_16835, partial [Prosthecobacter sp.]|nr:hypothetical protein [Prosthecobacter sp.]